MAKSLLFINRLIHCISFAVLLFLMFLTVADVTGRYFFNNPVRGTLELTELAMVVIVFLALGYAQHKGDHIVIDLAYERMPPFLQRISHYLASLISLVIVSLMAYRLYHFGLRMIIGNYTTHILRIPIYPVVWIAVAGAFFYALAILASFLDVPSSRGGEHEDDS